MSEKPMRADARRNRERVLAAAEVVLGRDGRAASMRDIAAEAGVGLATIYRQYPTKEALYEAIAMARVDRLLERARSLQAHPDAAAALVEMIAFAVAESTGEKALADSLAEAGRDPKGGTDALYRELESETDHLLQRAQADTTVRADVTIDEVAALITALCLAADRQRWGTAMRDRVVDVVADGLRSGGGERLTKRNS